MKYEDLIFKIPQESPCYCENSNFVISQIINILNNRKAEGDNKIIINTNLKNGLPLENINKIAGPMVEAWAGEVFTGIRDDFNNKYHLINVETQERLGMADIILQFRKNNLVLTGNIDVKATANDIPNSGKGPNITSFSRIIHYRSRFYLYYPFYQTSGLLSKEPSDRTSRWHYGNCGL